jgi:serine/threonine-protein kinase
MLASTTLPEARPLQPIPEELPPGSLLDGFRIDGPLGAGAMGAVYRATDGRTGEGVVLKRMLGGDSAGRRRFEREAVFLSQIKHPAVVGYRGHGTAADGSPYLVMDAIHGQDLEKFLESSPPLPWSVVRTLGLRLAAGLAEVHRRGVVHRDVGPRNVMLRSRNGLPSPEEPVLIDFGLALGELVPGHGLTRTATLAGTPRYMAPEQLRGEAPVPSADVYAVGAILYEALTGTPATPADDFTTLVRRLAEPPPLPSTNARVSAIVGQALDPLFAALLARNPWERPADGAALLSLLEGTPPSVPATYASFGPISAPSSRPLSPAPSATPLHAQSASPPGGSVFVAASGAGPDVGGIGKIIALVGVLGALAVLGLGAGIFFALRPSANPPPGTFVTAVAPTDEPTKAVATAATVATAPPPGTFAAAIVPGAAVPAVPVAPTVEAPRSTVGGTYEAADGHPAVSVVGGNSIVLEKCTIHAKGGIAVQIVGAGTASLTDCTVEGDLSIVGPGRIDLLRTTVQGVRKTVGGGTIYDRK